MTPERLLTLIEQGAAPAILDVRTGMEFRRGHVPGARHIPFHRLLASAFAVNSAPADPVVVYCGHGPRAQLAGRALRARGFRHVIYLTGHWAGWKRAGLRVETA